MWNVEVEGRCFGSAGVRHRKGLEFSNIEVHGDVRVGERWQEECKSVITKMVLVLVVVVVSGTAFTQTEYYPFRSAERWGVCSFHCSNIPWNHLSLKSCTDTLYYIGMSFMQKKIIHGFSVPSNKGFRCRGQNIAFPVRGVHYWGAHEWLSPCGHILSDSQLTTSASDCPRLKPVCLFPKTFPAKN